MMFVLILNRIVPRVLQLLTRVFSFLGTFSDWISTVLPIQQYWESRMMRVGMGTHVGLRVTGCCNGTSLIFKDTNFVLGIGRYFNNWDRTSKIKS